jgi:trans-aconitate methyltransferase
MRLAAAFVRLFGVPETGVHVRIAHVMRALPRDAESLIDLGCGAGMLLGAVERRRPGCRLTGFEIDGESAAIAAGAHPRATIVARAVEDAPHDLDGTFASAACIDVLEHLETPTLRRFLERARELLQPGGTLVVHVPKLGQRRHFRRFLEWGHHDHVREGFTRDELAGALRDAGFEVAEIRPTLGAVAAYAWEANMLVAAHPLQAIVFPLSLAVASLSERLPLGDGNGLLAVARRPPS